MIRIYEARIKKGEVTDTLAIQASNEAEARRILEGQGQILRIRRKTRLSIGRSLSRGDRIIFLRRLAMMMKSKVTITNSLNIISASFTGKVGEVAKILEQKILNGDDLIEAMRSLPADFPSATISLIKSGMHGGELHKALNDAAVFEGEMHVIGRKARNGIVVAAIEFLIAATLIIGTAYKVGPWVLETGMMKSSPESINVGWAFVLADILAVIIGLISIGMVVLFSIAYIFKPTIPDFSDKVILRIPVFRDLVLSRTYYSVFYGLSLLISSGVRLKDCLQLSASSAPDGAIKQDLMDAVEALEDGRSWASEMKNLHQTDRACIETSQDRQEIADAFMEIAGIHKINYSTRVEQVVPVLRLSSNFLMAMAGFLIFAMTMLPNLQMTRGILQ